MPANTVKNLNTSLTKQELKDSGIFPAEFFDNTNMRFFKIPIPAHVIGQGGNKYIEHASNFAEKDLWCGQAIDGQIYLASEGMIRGGAKEITS